MFGVFQVVANLKYLSFQKLSWYCDICLRQILLPAFEFFLFDLFGFYYVGPKQCLRIQVLAWLLPCMHGLSLLLMIFLGYVWEILVIGLLYLWLNLYVCPILSCFVVWGLNISHLWLFLRNDYEVYKCVKMVTFLCDA